MDKSLFFNAPVSNELFSELTDEEKAAADFDAMISVLLFEKRKELSMSVDEFAGYMHVKPETVTAWESLNCSFKVEVEDN